MTAVPGMRLSQAARPVHFPAVFLGGLEKRGCRVRHRLKPGPKPPARIE
jgi:hypothetical protein